MFKSYLISALRNLMRNRNYTIINFFGLAIGIAVCTIIFLVIQFELSFDTFHSKKDRIYRVLTEYHHADAPDIFYGRGVPAALPGSLPGTFPEIQKVAPIYTEGDDQIIVLDDKGQVQKKFKEERGVFFTPPSFFEIFDFPWLAGNSGTALKDPNCAVLTKETAEKYFGDWRKALGKYIKWKNQELLKITGVLATIPTNTDFQMKMVISYGTGPTAQIMKSTEWGGTSEAFGCYILLAPNVSVDAFNTKLRAFVKQHKPADVQDSHIIQSLSKVHYDDHVSNYLGKTISPQLIRTLWLIAAFILIIACVNFINLATAQAVNRAKEVGVRKVLGSNKTQLRFQFLFETFVLVLAAVYFAILLTMLTLPFIARTLDLPLSFHPFHNLAFLLFSFAIIIIVTLLAGFYPSLILSEYNPVHALKSKAQALSNKGFSLRRSLVVFQFIIAQVLIIATLIMVRQMNYFTNTPMGFDKNAIVNIPFPGDSIGISKLDYLQKQLAVLKGVEKVSFSSNVPAGEDNNWTTFTYEHAPKETDFYAIVKFSDADYVNTYHLQMSAGNDLQPSDTCKGFLINESLVKKLGLIHPEEAINKNISMWNGFLKGPIVGVIKDYHDRTFKNDDAPLIMTSFKRGYSVANIKLTPFNISSTLPAIENIWNEVFPDFAFEYQFLDDHIASFYKHESQLSKLYKIFAIIAIFLSCLGLYGLASFMAVQKYKEVGIRKVLGANAGSIVYLFSKEFMLLITIAFVISIPIAWYFMNQWLQDYVYRINISWWIFLIGGIISILIAFTTISFQAIKTAIANPIESLRTE